MPSTAASSFSVLPVPAKSTNDKKDYRVIALGNGLRALLISDTSYPLDKLAEEEAEATALVCSRVHKPINPPPPSTVKMGYSI